MQSYGMMLLAIYLVLVGLKAITGFTVPYDQMIFGFIAVATGVLIFLKK